MRKNLFFSMFIIVIIVIAYTISDVSKIMGTEKQTSAESTQTSAQAKHDSEATPSEEHQSANKLSTEKNLESQEKDPLKSSEMSSNNNQNELTESTTQESEIPQEPKAEAIVAEAIPQVIKIGSTFDKQPAAIVKVSSSNNVTYEYIDKSNEVDTTGSLYELVKVKLTDKSNTKNSLIVNVPVIVEAVNNNSEIIFGALDGVAYQSEFKNSNNTELDQSLIDAMHIVAWKRSTGERIKPSLSKPGLVAGKQPDLYSRYQIAITVVGTTYVRNMYITEKNEFENKLVDQFSKGWRELPLGSKKGLIYNPLNTSLAGINFRGLSSPQDTTYASRRSYQISYDGLEDPATRLFQTTYGDNTQALIYRPYINFVEQPSINSTQVYFARELYLIKDGKLRQVIVDSKNKVVYVLELYLAKNLNFVITMNMYNSDSVGQVFAARSGAQLNFLSFDPVYALGQNRGFYMKKEIGKQKQRMSVVSRDAGGRPLGKDIMLQVGTTHSGSPSSKPPVLGGVSIIKENLFGNDFSIPGIEKYNYSKDQLIKPGGTDWTSFYSGAKHEYIKPGESLKLSTEVFAGDELPYMIMNTQPAEINVYEDYNQDSAVDYRLSNIPEVGDYGEITFTYPDATSTKQRYKADADKSFSGKFTIPRATLPKVLNDQAGSIKKYSTDILAINEFVIAELPSEDYQVPINVYKIGAKPIPQLIQKGTAFTKTAEEILQNKIILPGHTAKYTYEGELPDTSKVGLTSVMVRMTDQDEPDKTALIKVPIQVIEGVPPIKGLYLIASDFDSQPDPFKDVTQDEVNKKIVALSEAIAWDVATGSSDDITISVESTTLKPNPTNGKYTAKLKAVKGTETVRKDITINIQTNQDVHIEFIDDGGNSLYDKVTLTKPIGTTIDLTKEASIQKALKSIDENHYQIAKRPELETAIPVKPDPTTVRYEFKGTLYVQSSPTLINFGRKMLGNPFIKVENAKYDQPLIVWDNRNVSSSWNLSAKLKKVLTSEEDSDKTLPSALRYKVSSDQTVILSPNYAQVIATRAHKEKGKYDISSEWNKGNSGLILEVQSGHVLKDGRYQATILWQVEQTP